MLASTSTSTASSSSPTTQDSPAQTSVPISGAQSSTLSDSGNMDTHSTPNATHSVSQSQPATGRNNHQRRNAIMITSSARLQAFQQRIRYMSHRAGAIARAQEAISGSPRPGQQPPPVVHSITQIFRFRTWQPLKNEVPPRLNETMPLTLYYHSDEYLTRAIKSLKKVTDTTSDTFRRRNERVHRAQKLLLDSIHIIYLEMDEEMRSSREYRRQLPPEDQRELDQGFSENILFAAQALSQGFRIRGIEQFTAELTDPARELCASLEALRFVFRSRSLTNPLPHHQDLFGVLSVFDRAWAAFEQKICFCYFSVTYSGRIHGVPEMDLFQVVMSETIMRAIRLGYLEHEHIQSFEPAVMFSVPRLTIVSALYHTPEVVNVLQEDTPLRWFRSRLRTLHHIKDILSSCHDAEIRELERMLVSNEENNSMAIGTSNLNIEGDDCAADVDAAAKPNMETKQRPAETFVDGEKIKHLFRTICSVSDGMIRARDFVGMMQTVFQMHGSSDWNVCG